MKTKIQSIQQRLQKLGVDSETSDAGFLRVFLPLKPVEWCELCMRDGPEYIGPCCGNTGYVQDILAGVFRNSGWIDADDLAAIYSNLSDHDEGMIEVFSEDKSATYLKQSKSEFRALRWHEKVASIWAHVGNHLDMPNLSAFKVRSESVSDIDRAIGVLANGLNALSWSMLLGERDDSNLDPNLPEPRKQEIKRGIDRENAVRHANTQMLLARVWPALKTVYAEFSKYSKPFEGVALVEAGSETAMTNRMGACVYGTEEQAREVIGWNAGTPDLKIDLRKCRVTMEEGLVLGEVIEANITPKSGE